MCTQRVDLTASYNKMASVWRWITGEMVGWLLVLMLGIGSPLAWAEDMGVTDKVIRIGATIPLQGDHKAHGLTTKRGMDAALAGQVVQKRTIEFVVLNDFYDPAKTVVAAKELIDKGIFAMVHSFGSATARAVLPLLAEKKIPAFGFYTGAAFSGPGDVLNFRTGYVKEVEAVADVALAAGIKPNEICAYVQNDLYGISGLGGLRTALSRQPGAGSLIAKIDEVIKAPGDNPARNGIGPVGVYPRDTTSAREGYQSLKAWETASGHRCRLVVTTAVYEAAATFMGYARYKGETWIFSSPSTAAGITMEGFLKTHKVVDKVIATQVVPAPDSALPIVVEARKALGDQLDYVSLESYIVGRLFVTILQAIEGPLTRENFLKAARSRPYDIGGIKVDFTTDNQGSDFVLFTLLRDEHFAPVTAQDVAAVFK